MRSTKPSRRVDAEVVVKPVKLPKGPPPAAPPCKVAILGFGTVGRSVAKILWERPSARARFHVTYIYNRNVERKRVSWLPQDVRWTDRIEDVLNSDVDVVVEVVGGLNPAEHWVRAALQSGKSVVTANKQLIARCGPELAALAKKKGRHIEYGASVAGGIPVLSGLQDGLSGDRLFRVCGILNGTCNYILTRMESAGVSFAAALKEAQEQGFAEADPTDDVDGYDARSKLAILARAGLHTEVRPEEILCCSIRVIEDVDFMYSNMLGCTIRQVSCAEKQGRLLYASVQPSLVPLASPVARVHSSQNLVMATGEYGGETVFSGYGAGGNPTAVAVVSDLISIARRGEYAMNGIPEVPHTPRKVTSDFTTKHYLRVTVKDKPGILYSVTRICNRYQINVDSVLQKPGFPKEKLPFVVTLEACKAATVEKAMKEIAQLEFLVQPPVCLPMMD
jgi:homoserine dehydrogenase